MPLREEKIEGNNAEKESEANLALLMRSFREMYVLRSY